MSRIDLKKHKGKIFLFGFGFIIGICPVIIGHVVSLPILNEWTNENDWIGFWGSYIGSILGGVITLYVLNATVNVEAKRNARQEKIEYFNDVVKLSSQLVTSVGNSLALATRTIVKKDGELYKQYLIEQNIASGLSVQLNIMMSSRADIYDLEYFRGKWEIFINYYNFVNDEFEKIVSANFSDKEEIDKVVEKMDIMISKIDRFVNDLSICVKENL